MVIDNDKEKVEVTDVSQENNDYIAWKDALSFCQQYSLSYSNKVKLVQGILDKEDLYPECIDTLYTMAITDWSTRLTSGYLPVDHTVHVEIRINNMGMVEMFYAINKMRDKRIGSGTVTFHEFITAHTTNMKNLVQNLHAVVNYCHRYHQFNESLKIK